MSEKCFHCRIIYFFLGHIVFLSVRVFGFYGDIVIQNVYKKSSFAFNDSEEKLETMTEALNEAYQQQNDRINQLQIWCNIFQNNLKSLLSFSNNMTLNIKIDFPKAN
jgi:hypothetical protein